MLRAPLDLDAAAPKSVVVRRLSVAGVGYILAVVLMVAAAAIPAMAGWHLYAGFPPLNGDWEPRIGPGTVPALTIGTLSVISATRLCGCTAWGRMLGVCWLTSLGWLLSLALVDGPAGIARILATPHEYLHAARATHDISATLHEFISRIPTSSPDSWSVHVAGHPPGALLFFVLLVRLGLGSGLAAGLVTTIIASTTPIAVLVTLRTLGVESMARRAAPLLVLSPAAIWAAVSADGMFAAVAAWGLAALALGAVRRSIGWSSLAGSILGYCMMLSYGLPLLGILAVAVLLAARSNFPQVPGLVAALGVVLVFAAAGFSWWDAYPVLRERYWDGVASLRPTTYWIWGDLAALCFSAGPLMAAGLANAFRHARTSFVEEPSRVVLLLSGAAAAAVVAADASLLAKAEVERIWLPFVPWLLVACGTLSARWRQRGLAAQILLALLIQHLLFTGW